MALNPRYKNAASDFFSEQNIIDGWGHTERAILLARAIEHPDNPKFKEAADALSEIGHVDVARKEEIEKENNHDLDAAIRAMGEQVDAMHPKKNYGRLIHQGVTSYDTEDTSMSLLLASSGKKTVESLRGVADALMAKANMFKYTPCNGYTHSQIAEPITIGKRFLDPAVGVSEQIDQFEKEVEKINVCKIKGATGVYSGSLSPEFEERVAKILGQKVSKVSTQILPIEDLLAFFHPFPIIASKLQNLAYSLCLSSGDLAEVKEKFKKGQTGSSIMTYKQNPIRLENIIGATRKIKALYMELMDATLSLRERDISGSFQIVRHIIPEMFETMEHVSSKTKAVIGGLSVFPIQGLRALIKYPFTSAGAAKALFAKLLPEDDGANNKKLYSFIQGYSLECKYSSDWLGVPKSLFDALAPEIKKIGGQKAVSELEMVMSLPHNLRNIGGVWRVATGKDNDDGIHEGLADYMINSGQMEYFWAKDSENFINTYGEIVRANYKTGGASERNYADLHNAMSRLNGERARLIKEKVIAA